MDKEFLKKCWKDKRWHSLMVLILWIISLSFFTGVVTIMGKLHSTEERKIDTFPNSIEKNWEEKIKELVKEEKELSFTVEKKDGSLRYEGIEKNGVVNGYRIREDEIIKYRILDGVIYEVNLDTLKETTSIYNEIDETLLNTKKLIKKILELDFKVSKEKENEIDYTYIEEALQIEVLERQEKIEKIIIENKEDIYTLLYRY